MSGMKKILLVMGIGMMAALAGCAGNQEDVTEDPVEGIVSEEESESGISENEISDNEEAVNGRDENGLTAWNEVEDEKMIYYVIDDKVNEMPLFSAFINGEITAYDNELQEEMYCVDYYDKYFWDYDDLIHKYLINSIQIAAEDLDGDGKEELMIIIMDVIDQGDLYVFHEDDGRLYAWEVMNDFYTPRIGTVYLLDDGIFESFGGYGVGHYFRRYNEMGEVEDVLNYYYYSDYSGSKEEGREYDYALTVYEQGMAVRELRFSVMVYGEELPPDEGELLSGTQEDREECIRIVDEFMAGLSDRVRDFYYVMYEDNVVEVPLSTIVVNPDMR